MTTRSMQTQVQLARNRENVVMSKRSTPRSHRPFIRPTNVRPSGSVPAPHFDNQPAAVVLDERVKIALNASPYFRGRLNVIGVEMIGDHTIRLTGMVPSFYLKQQLQSIVQQVEGVDQVQNDVGVYEA